MEIVTSRGLRLKHFLVWLFVPRRDFVRRDLYPEGILCEGILYPEGILYQKGFLARYFVPEGFWANGFWDRAKIPPKSSEMSGDENSIWKCDEMSCDENST